ncbi:NADPH:quinone reductase [Tersicoccus phoenicis]|uniref:NADPH:quinone reductase n=1 Tax=Tersicoccus phoenicis TaxID=554083 RepID=A0A1R1L9H8_9MICC|nr:NADP-dependent oxidoreductase [Tersicoccus phoenicis]OMH24177.1 NADPH:quinone reductase [Tersicoccus phoenicis]
MTVTSMHAFGFTAYGGPEVMQHLDVPVPVPGRGELLVRMAAAGVNPADIKVRSGQRQNAFPVRFPMAVGREAAGEIVAVGDDVDGWRPGDAVFGAAAAGTGALADLVVLSAGSVARRPPAVPPEQAACVPVSVGTAWDALAELDLPAGTALLVLGAGGGVGTAVCGLAAARGITVLGVASAGKRDLVEGLGAVHVASGDGWSDRVRAAAASGVGGAVDGVMDLVGGQVLWDGAALARDPRQIRSVAEPQLAASLGGSGVTRRRTTAVFTAIVDAVAAGTFTPVVTATWPLAQAEHAVAAVETGHAAGNVVVVADTRTVDTLPADRPTRADDGAARPGDPAPAGDTAVAGSPDPAP